MMFLDAWRNTLSQCHRLEGRHRQPACCIRRLPAAAAHSAGKGSADSSSATELQLRVAARSANAGHHGDLAVAVHVDADPVHTVVPRHHRPLRMPDSTAA